MRLARKMFVLAAMALTALAMTATTANAQVEVSDEATTAHCSAVSLNIHAVTGGCDFEVRSEHHIPLVVQTAGGPVTISNCSVTLESQIGEDGSGYVSSMSLRSETPPTNPPCTRAACDEANGAEIPWPIAIVEGGPGNETVEATFCLRTIASGPGGAGTSCEVHLGLSTTGHNHEVGNNDNHSCENQPAISIQNVHFVSDSDEIVIVH